MVMATSVRGTSSVRVAGIVSHFRYRSSTELPDIDRWGLIARPEREFWLHLAQLPVDTIEEITTTAVNKPKVFFHDCFVYRFLRLQQPRKHDIEVSILVSYRPLLPLVTKKYSG